MKNLILVGIVLYYGSVADGQSNYATPYTFVTLAGTPGAYGTTDGSNMGPTAQFEHPAGIAFGVGTYINGNIYIADSDANTIREISSGVEFTLAGSPGVAGTADGHGTAAQFDQPNGIAVDSSGVIFVADSGNNTIRKITNNVTTGTAIGVVTLYGSYAPAAWTNFGTMATGWTLPGDF